MSQPRYLTFNLNNMEDFLFGLLGMFLVLLLAALLWGLGLSYERMSSLYDAVDPVEIQKICETQYTTTPAKNIPAKCLKFYQ